MSNSGKNIDRRILKTKKAIRNAVAKLLSEKNVTDITITEIVNLADINRKTFYNYYSNVYQVFDEIENEVLNDLSQVIENVDLREVLKNPYALLKNFTTIINKDIDFYGHLLSMSHNASLSAKTASMLKEKTKEIFAEQFNIYDDKLDIILDFIHSGMITVYQSWFLSNRAQSLEDITQAISVMCLEGINGMLKHYKIEN